MEHDAPRTSGVEDPVLLNTTSSTLPHKLATGPPPPEQEKERPRSTLSFQERALLVQQLALRSQLWQEIELEATEMLHDGRLFRHTNELLLSTMEKRGAHAAPPAEIEVDPQGHPIEPLPGCCGLPYPSAEDLAEMVEEHEIFDRGLERFGSLYGERALTHAEILGLGELLEEQEEEQKAAELARLLGLEEGFANEEGGEGDAALEEEILGGGDRVPGAEDELRQPVWGELLGGGRSPEGLQQLHPAARQGPGAGDLTELEAAFLADLDQSGFGGEDDLGADIEEEMGSPPEDGIDDSPEDAEEGLESRGIMDVGGEEDADEPPQGDQAVSGGFQFGLGLLSDDSDSDA